MNEHEEMIKREDLDMADARDTMREVAQRHGIECRARKAPREVATDKAGRDDNYPFAA